MHLAFLCPFLGAVLLLLTAFELYATLLRARKRPGPLSTRLNRALWSAASRVSRHWPRERRHAALAVVGPLLLPMLGCLMVLLLVCGFALVYLPHLHQGFAIAASGRSAWQDALYFSGVTLLTIGYGDITPRTEGLRLLALVEGASGIAVLSLATAYLLTVYSAVEQKRAKALTMHHQGRREASPAGLIAHAFRRGSFHGLEEFLRSGTRDLQVVLESHIEHPVIYYFHSESVAKSFPRMIFLMLETPTLLASCLDAKRYEDLVDSPDVSAAQETAGAVLEEVLNSLQLEDGANQSAEAPAQVRSRREDTFARARATFAAKGMALQPEGEGLARFLAQRELWETRLLQMTRFLGYDWQEISGDRLV